MESENTGAAKLVCFRILLNGKFRSNLPVYEIRVENIEFVALHHLQPIKPFQYNAFWLQSLSIPKAVLMLKNTILPLALLLSVSS